MNIEAIVVYTIATVYFDSALRLYLFIFNFVFLFLTLGLYVFRSTECTSIAGHSSQHNLTQHDMLPQHPISTTKLISDYF